MGNKVPLEIVRIRVKRAQALGLSYPQYASVLMGSGRDIVGFLFTVDGLQLRLRQRLELPDQVRTKLGAIGDCGLLAMAPSGEPPEAFRLELSDVSGAEFVHAGRPPEVNASWSATRDAIRSTLDPLKLSSKSVVMIGGRGFEEDWALAGNLAKFIPSESYFSSPVSDFNS